MASQRVIGLAASLLDRAGQAAVRGDWAEMESLGKAALALDPSDEDAAAVVRAAGVMLAASPRTAADEQTGQVYVLRPEDRRATFVASLSGMYLLVALGFFIWMLFDTWTGRDLIVTQMGYSKDVLTHGSYRLLAFTALAGGLGGILNGIRSLISWHAERDAYGVRFIWKDVACPFIGGTVGVFAYVALRSGVGVVSGDFSLSDPNGIATLSAFAVAAVAGFSWHQVFKWLDSQANRIFSTTAASVPASKASGARAGTSGPSPAPVAVDASAAQADLPPLAPVANADAEAPAAGPAAG